MVAWRRQYRLQAREGSASWARAWLGRSVRRRGLTGPVRWRGLTGLVRRRGFLPPRQRRQGDAPSPTRSATFSSFRGQIPVLMVIDSSSASLWRWGMHMAPSDGSGGFSESSSPGGGGNIEQGCQWQGPDPGLVGLWAFLFFVFLFDLPRRASNRLKKGLIYRDLSSEAVVMSASINRICPPRKRF
jgi:hypothetical protein